MGIRTVKPTSPARRYLTYVTSEEITKTAPEKSLLQPKGRISGRNVYGRITVRHRGGGAKRMLRQVDFRRDKTGRPARGGADRYDPNGSARPVGCRWTAWRRSARSEIWTKRTSRSARRGERGGADSVRPSAGR